MCLFFLPFALDHMTMWRSFALIQFEKKKKLQRFFIFCEQSHGFLVHSHFGISHVTQRCMTYRNKIDFSPHLAPHVNMRRDMSVCLCEQESNRTIQSVYNSKWEHVTHMYYTYYPYLFTVLLDASHMLSRCLWPHFLFSAVYF